MSVISVLNPGQRRGAYLQNLTPAPVLKAQARGYTDSDPPFRDSPGLLTGFLVGVPFLLFGGAGEYGTPVEELSLWKWSFSPLMEWLS